MATTISRTWYNTLIDDDGSGLTGSIIDKADMGAILDAIDAMIGADITFGGLVSTQGMGTHAFGASFNGPQIISLHNPNVGAAAYAGLRFGNANDSAAGELVQLGAGFSAAGAPYAADMLAITSRRAGIAIAATGGGGSVRIHTGGTAERWRVENDGVMYGMTGGGDNSIRATGSTGKLTLAGGGALVAGAGAYMELFGATSAGVGEIRLWMGGGAASEFKIVRPDGIVGMSLLGTGKTQFNCNTEVAWTFNNTHANGGFLQTAVNGTPTVYVGSRRSILGTGANTEGMVYGNALLWLDGGTGVHSNTINSAATANPANMYIDPATAKMMRSTSSLRYKTRVEPLREWRWLLDLSPITFTAISDPHGRRFGGLAAEDVAAHGPRGDDGAPLFAGLNPDGKPEDVAYSHMIAPLVAAVQNLERRLAAMEGRTEWR